MKRTSKGASASTPKPLLKLVKVTPIRRPAKTTKYISQDCVEALKYLLKLAKKSEVDGLSIIASYSDNTFNCKLFGKSVENSLSAIALMEVFKADLMVEFNKRGTR
jgi:CRISPR/Cas system-associated protein Csm6